MFSPINYWIIADSTTDVYAGATNTMVPVADQTYQDWLVTGTPVPIGSEAELSAVIQSYGLLPAWLFAATDTFIQPTPTTYTMGQLAAYTAAARYDHAGGGVVVTSLGGPVPFLSDPVSRNTINSAYDFMILKGSGTVQWKLSDGTFITLDKTKITTLMNDVATFVQSCFSCESTTVTNINSGSITTTAAIDAAFAAVSNVFP